MAMIGSQQNRATHSLATPCVGFIGAGRLARALALALLQAGIPAARVASRQIESARRMAQELEACQAVELQSLVDGCDLVFITTPDAAIAEVARTLVWKSGQQVVHCSGATPVTVLQPAADVGALIGGFHPMQAFGADTQAAVDSLPGCTIAIEADTASLSTLLHGLAHCMGCVGLSLPPEARVRYHASGGYASQHIHVLMAEAVRLWQSWGATEEQALSALLPLLRGTLESLSRSGVAAGMPGPISRGDGETVQQHRRALLQLDPEMRELYDQLCRRSITLAQRAGRLQDAQAQAMRQVLDEP
ncbi:DUF2520 domain-containing protein [Alcaligenaceae bacterium CGII-47]|nr:DUF2520 domain-containing protein [Alcaligenaceae bacterium CGII-47]